MLQNKIFLSHLSYLISGDYPYTCSHCGKGFAGKSQHKNHESRHTGGLLF